jgi:hypothetical protein
VDRALAQAFESGRVSRRIVCSDGVPAPGPSAEEVPIGAEEGPSGADDPGRSPGKSIGLWMEEVDAVMVLTPAPAPAAAKQVPIGAELGPMPTESIGLTVEEEVDAVVVLMPAPGAEAQAGPIGAEELPIGAELGPMPTKNIGLRVEEEVDAVVVLPLASRVDLGKVLTKD